MRISDWSSDVCSSDFVSELNRYNDAKLRIDDPALREVRIFGVFQTRNRDNVQRLLAQGWGIQSRPLADNEILLTRPSHPASFSQSGRASVRAQVCKSRYLQAVALRFKKKKTK